MKRIYIISVLLVNSLITSAQRDSMSHMPMHEMKGMSMDDHKMSSMSSAYSLSLPISRNGSGTGWLPDATPMYGIMVHTDKWMFMFHGDIFPRYNYQDMSFHGRGSGDQVDAPDMLMVMGQRMVTENSMFHFNLMLSTDALITGGNGYPLLFQTGESWHGRPLVDRQHPHDLFSELSVSHSYSFNKKADAFIYVGYPGEPALGPVTFMHRPSGEFMPDAPIGHHWEDATHITFGVATVGFRYGKFKIEGSSFTGREPDEDRYNFDMPRFDSRSGRLSFNPDANWALQVSTGYIKSPEALHPDEDVYRTTASATYVYPFSHAAYIAATALWGQNQTPGYMAQNAALIEATLKVGNLALYTRYETVQKSAEELGFFPRFYPIVDRLYVMSTVTLGAAYDLFNLGPIRVAAGGQFSMGHTDTTLDKLYGVNPVSGEVYLHLYPHLMHAHS